MPDIKIQSITRDDHGSTFRVTVTEDGSATSHIVKVKREDYERLAVDKVSEEELLKKSFKFLLARESKESILSEFDLMTIAKYFSEYESEMRK